MKPDFYVGCVEVKYNPNGHTYWLEGIIDDYYHKTHWDAHTTSLEDGLKEFLASINKEYWAYATKVSLGWHGNEFHYDIWW